MRRFQAAASLTLLLLSPLTVNAQGKKTEQAEKKVSTLIAEFNEEIRGYERELKYFQRVPEFKPLLELRTQLVTQAAQVSKLDTKGRGTGPAILELAREMDSTARKLDVATARLEKRAEVVSNAEGRTVAERMKTHADVMVKTIDQLIAMFR